MTTLKGIKTNPRATQLMHSIIVLITLGFLYFIFISITHISIPCVFHLLTGLKCPGCGITTAIMYLAHFDFTNAYAANPLVIWLLPILAVYGLYKAKQYLEYKEHFSRVEICFLLVLLVITLGFGIARNIL